MLKISAAALVGLLREIGDAKHGLMAKNVISADDREERERLRAALITMRGAFRGFPLSRSLEMQIERLVTAIADRETMGVLTMTTEVENNLYYEIEAWSFYAVRPDRRGFYEKPESFFDVSAFSAFPDSEADILAAGRCFALDEWTACVFHLMRAVESALRSWFTQLAIPFRMPVSEANWQELVNAVNSKLAALEQQPRSEQRAADLQYLGATATHFNTIKNAWRNHVMHNKGKYDEREALEVFQAVSAFMRACSARPSPGL